MLSRSLVYQNRGDEATGILEQALAVRERVYGPSQMGRSLLRMGRAAAAERETLRGYEILSPRRPVPR
jgi:hypothetical protein